MSSTCWKCDKLQAERSCRRTSGVTVKDDSQLAALGEEVWGQGAATEPTNGGRGRELSIQDVDVWVVAGLRSTQTHVGEVQLPNEHVFVSVF